MAGNCTIRVGQYSSTEVFCLGIIGATRPKLSTAEKFSLDKRKLLSYSSRFVSGRLRSLLRMLRSHPSMRCPTITMERYKAGRLHFDHRNICDVLLVRMDLAQLTATFWTTWQGCHLRLLDLVNPWQLAMGKPLLPRFAPRSFGMLHPMPPRKRYCLTFLRSLQFVNFCLQAFHLLLKSLNRSQCLSQLLLQLGDPLVFWVRGACSASVACSSQPPYMLPLFSHKSFSTCNFQDV